VFKAVNLAKIYGEHVIFSDVNLIVERGEKVAYSKPHFLICSNCLGKVQKGFTKAKHPTFIAII
jgi:hypothetical protein